jgi:Ca-activated chloride channel family protein
MTLKLELRANPSVLRSSGHNRLDVLIRVLAPAERPADERPKSLNLALVLDRSGSMAGQPFEEAKRCAANIIRGLGPTDYVSVVAYDSGVEIVKESGPVTDPEKIIASLKGLQTGDYTALYDGWQAGAEQAARQAGKADISRVLLLSDGHANQGITSPEQIAAACRQMAEAGVSTSTYGLGQEFNEALMGAMASAGQGNAYYGSSASDLAEHFAAEFELLRAIAGRSVRLKWEVEPGFEATLLNGYQEGPDGSYILPNVPYGGEAWALLSVEARPGFLPRTMSWIVDASVSYLHGDSPCALSATFRLPAVSDQAGRFDKPDELVMRRRLELDFARIQDLAREAARERNWTRVQQLLQDARALAEGNPWLAAGLTVLEAYASQRDEERFSKEAHYRSRRLSSRVASSDETGAWQMAEEAQKPSFLQRRAEEGKSG